MWRVDYGYNSVKLIERSWLNSFIFILCLFSVLSEMIISWSLLLVTSIGLKNHTPCGQNLPEKINKFTHSVECFKCTIRVCRERHWKLIEKWTPLSRQRVGHSVANPKFNDKIYLKIVVCRLKPQQAETQAVHSKAGKKPSQTRRFLLRRAGGPISRCRTPIRLESRKYSSFVLQKLYLNWQPEETTHSKIICSRNWGNGSAS